MRTNAILALALTSIVAPALAYPSTYAGAAAKREVADLLARADGQDVYARSFGSDFVQGFEKGFTGTIKTLAPIALSFLKRADDIDLLARQALDEHMRRTDLEERSFGSDFVQGFKKGFTGTIKALAPIALGLLRREDIEMLARDALLDHIQRRDLEERSFGSDFVQGFEKGFTGTIKALAPVALSLLRREDFEILARSDEELLARSFGSDFVEGFKKGFTGTIKTLAPIALSVLKREEPEMFARSYSGNVARTLNDLD